MNYETEQCAVKKYTYIRLYLTSPWSNLWVLPNQDFLQTGWWCWCPTNSVKHWRQIKNV